MIFQHFYTITHHICTQYQEKPTHHHQRIWLDFFSRICFDEQYFEVLFFKISSNQKSPPITPECYITQMYYWFIFIIFFTIPFLSWRTDRYNTVCIFIYAFSYINYIHNRSDLSFESVHFYWMFVFQSVTHAHFCIHLCAVVTFTALCIPNTYWFPSNISR